MLEEKIQQFLNWLSECEAKEENRRSYVYDYDWKDFGRYEAYHHVKEMFQTAFREELR